MRSLHATPFASRPSLRALSDFRGLAGLRGWADLRGWAGLLLIAGLSGCTSAATRMETAEPNAPTAAASSTTSARQDAPEESGASGSGETSAADLAKQLSNPVASLISVPFQLNFDDDVGPAEGERITLNIQPVIPLSLDEEWNVILRSVLPIISQDDIPAGEDDTGIGDLVQSAFFSPVEPTESGWIWGAGPAFLVPTARKDTLGAEQWGIGPTGVALKQSGPWTYGALANHIWSYAGDDDRADVNATFLQPFVSYTTPDAWTFTANMEGTYDWDAEDWTIPVHANVSKVLKLGDQLISVGGGFRYWADESTASPEGLGFRFIVTFLFPN